LNLPVTAGCRPPAVAMGLLLDALDDVPYPAALKHEEEAALAAMGCVRIGWVGTRATIGCGMLA